MPTELSTAFQAQYFQGKTLDPGSLLLSRNDQFINFNWGSRSPDAKVANDNFSARWTGQIQATTTGSYTFTTTSDDGVRLWVNGQQLVNNWTDHAGTDNSGTIVLQAGQKYDVKMEYYESGGDAISTLRWTRPDGVTDFVPAAASTPAAAVATELSTAFQAQYFQGKTLDPGSLLLSRNDQFINFNWGSGSPDAKVSNDNFSARWTGQIQATTTGSYTFTTTSDDGVRLWVNGQQLVNNWTDHAGTDNSGTIVLQAGQKYNVKMEYYESGGDAISTLRWTRPDGVTDFVPAAAIGGIQTPPVPTIPVDLAPATTTAVAVATELSTAFQAQYFQGKTLDPGSLLLSRNDQFINFNWGSGSPDAKVSNDNFSARWTGQIQATTTGSYTFTTTSDDGVRLWVNGQQLVNNWTDHAGTDNSGTIVLQAGQKYNVKMEYYESGGDAISTLRWTRPDGVTDFVPAAAIGGIQTPPVPTIPVDLAPYDSIPNSPNEAYPDGVPSYYSWYNSAAQPAWGNKPRTDWNAVTAWGQLYAAKGFRPEQAPNTRVQLRNDQLWILSKSTMQWTQTQLSGIQGGAFNSDFGNNVVTGVTTKDESSNGGGISVIAGNGFNFHFWPGQRATMNPTDIAGVYSVFQGRLILDNANGSDDRPQARYIASGGADYWRSVDAPFASDWSNNGGVGGGKFKFVTNDWQSYSFTTLTPEQLLGNPPPISGVRLTA